MPSAKRATPDSYVPALDVIAAVVAAHPGVSLRALAGFLWADLPWSPSTPTADSALLRMRQWPGLARRISAATWLADRCSDLAMAGKVVFGPRDRREIDASASVTLFPARVGAQRVGHA